MTVGWLLRRWRTDVVRRTAAGVAADLGIVRAAVANWEAGLRVPDRARLEQIDRLYCANGTLAALCRAVGTPDALDPDRVWWHHFPDQGGPCWAWVRVPRPPAVVSVSGRWGPLRADVQADCGSTGLLLTLPTSSSHPPLCVTVDPPGWVDFGNGAVPAELPIASRSVLSAIRPVLPPDPALGLMLGRLRPLMRAGTEWADRLESALGVGQLLGVGSPAPPERRVLDLSTRPASAPIVSSTQWDGARYRLLRRARNMSRGYAAERVSELWPAEPLLEGQLELFERGGRPRVDELPARLDLVYQADGRSLVAPSGIARDSGAVFLRPPSWWQGPLWIQPFSVGEFDETARLRIVWEPWEKVILVGSGSVLSFRKSARELSRPAVHLPDGWGLRAGIGKHPEAVSVDHDWWPLSDERAKSIFHQYVGAYLALLGRNVDSPRNMLRQTPAGGARARTSAG